MRVRTKFYHAKQIAKFQLRKSLYRLGNSAPIRYLVRSLQQDQRLNNENPFFVRQAILIKSSLLAYTDDLVYKYGDRPSLFIRANGPVSLQIEHFTPMSKQLVETQEIHLSCGSVPIVFDTFSGFQEKDFVHFAIDTKNHSGWIQATISASDEKMSVPFFIEETPRKDVLFVESTDTFRAYVAKDSVRTYYRRHPPHILGGFTRPRGYPVDYRISHFLTAGEQDLDVNCSDHLINADLVLKGNLDEMNIDYDIVSDDFFDGEVDLTQFRLIILGAHNEYWTATKLARIRDFVDGGGSLLLLGGNTAWRWVARGDGYDLIWGNEILTGDPTYEGFIEKILGSYFNELGYGTYAPFVLKDASDLLDDEFSDVTRFGEGTQIRRCKCTVLGASGHETDKAYRESSEFTVLASGMNLAGQGGADVMYRPFRNHSGQVLNFGSIALWHRLDDPVIRNIIQNFVSNSSRKASQDSRKP